MIFNFFEEKVEVRLPPTFDGMRQAISENFYLSPEDVAELVIYSIVDDRRVSIDSQKVYSELAKVSFTQKKNFEIFIEISEKSKLYQKEIEKSNANPENLKDSINEEKEKLLNEIREKERILKEMIEKENLERENLRKKLEEQERLEREEQERLAKVEEERIAKELEEKERLAREEEKKAIEREALAREEEILALERIAQEEARKRAEIEEFERQKKESKLLLKQQKKEEKEKLKEEKKLLKDAKKEKKNSKKSKNDPIDDKVESERLIREEQERQEVEKVEKEELKKKKEKFIKEVKSQDSNKEDLKSSITHIINSTLEKAKESLINKTLKRAMKMIDKKIKPQTEEKTSNVVHPTHTCDGCKVRPIVGIRYHCTVCRDFDFCENCEEQHGESHVHPMVKFRTAQNHPHIRCGGPHILDKIGELFKNTFNHEEKFKSLVDQMKANYDLSGIDDSRILKAVTEANGDIDEAFIKLVYE